MVKEYTTHITAQEYLKLLEKNPERFGTTREHISKVNRDSKRLAEVEEKDRVKREVKVEALF